MQYFNYHIYGHIAMSGSTAKKADDKAKSTLFCYGIAEFIDSKNVQVLRYTAVFIYSDSEIALTRRSFV